MKYLIKLLGRKRIVFGTLLIILFGLLFLASDRDISRVRASEELVGEQTGSTVDSELTGSQTGSILDACPESSRAYPQCGGTVGLEGRDPTHTFTVTEFTNPCTGAKSWDPNPQDLGDLGQCGVSRQSISTQICTENRREYPQCGGTVGLEGYPRTDTILVAEFTNSCTEGKRYQVVADLGNRGECFIAPTATPAPASVPTATPTPTNVPTSTPTPIRVVTATPTPIRAASLAANVSCPNGFIQVVSNSNIICMQQVQTQQQTTSSFATANTGPISVNVAGGPVLSNVTSEKQPVVILTDSQLPKTGLPEMAWALSGLAPVGFGLSKFRNHIKLHSNIAHYIWQKREFDRN